LSYRSRILPRLIEGYVIFGDDEVGVPQSGELLEGRKADLIVAELADMLEHLQDVNQHGEVTIRLEKSTHNKGTQRSRS
jgi:hypothetical protein